MDQPIRCDASMARLPVPYEHRLRIVGRHLDRDGYRGATIVEVPDGMVVRAIDSQTMQPVVLEILDTDIPELLSEVRSARGNGERSHHHPLLPTGYEDVLRAVGYRLDQEAARWITVTELATQLVVAGWVMRTGHHHSSYQPLEIVLPPDSIERMLDAAFRRRRTAQGRRTIFNRLRP